MHNLVFLFALVAVAVDAGEYCRHFTSECRQTKCHHYDILQCNKNENVCQCYRPGEVCMKNFDDEECAHSCYYPNTEYRCDFGTCACSFPGGTSLTDLLG